MSSGSNKSSYDSTERASYSTGNTTPESGAKDSGSNVVTTETAPDGNNNNNTTAMIGDRQQATCNEQHQHSNSDDDSERLFVKTDIYTKGRTSLPHRTFSSIKICNTASTVDGAADSAGVTNASISSLPDDDNNHNGTTARSSSSSASENIHVTGSSDTNSGTVVINEKSRIQTPASTSTSQASSVEIGAQFPFLNHNNERPAPMFKSHSELVLPTRATKTQSEHSSPKKPYKPAQVVIKPSDIDTSLRQSTEPVNDYQTNKFPYIGINNEEENRRYIYSVPSSPSSSSFNNSALAPKQIKEPKTPVYIPAVLRTTSQVQTTSQFNLSSGPPSKAHWKPNGSRRGCATCYRPFSIFERRHHCRKCGDIFCSQDSSYSIRLDHTVSFNHLNGAISRACQSCSQAYQKYKESLYSIPNSTTTTLAAGMPININSTTNDDMKNSNNNNNPSSLNNNHNHNLSNYLQRQSEPTGNSIPSDWNWSTF